LLLQYGWEHRCCHVWDKGIGHVAGNSNTETLRKLPVVTEVCVQYVKAARFVVDGRQMTMQEWLRHQWQRTGLPLRLSNEACGVLNAATRKYLTADHLWYYPPPEAFARMVDYANRRGRPEGRPYFSVDGKRPIAASEWARLRAKFTCPAGLTNVWKHPQVAGMERINGTRQRMKWKYSSLHGSQKPLKLIEIGIATSTEKGDVVWEPFGGLCPAAICSAKIGRKCVSAEVVSEFYLAAIQRLASIDG
jgi:site-specific DNA-methyltransferase (adenine-specific)